MGDVQETLDANRANLDETLENIRASSQNLKQFTDTIKQRPFSLIRIKAQKDRVPPIGK
jgi:ABC-type transporter Mla subunit MlaD